MKNKQEPLRDKALFRVMIMITLGQAGLRGTLGLAFFPERAPLPGAGTRAGPERLAMSHKYAGVDRRCGALGILPLCLSGGTAGWTSSLPFLSALFAIGRKLRDSIVCKGDCGRPDRY